MIFNCPDCETEMIKGIGKMECPACGYTSVIAYNELMRREVRILPQVKVKSDYYDKVKNKMKEKEVKSYSSFMKNAYKIAYNI